MTTPEEAALLIKRLKETNPAVLFKELDDINAGIRCVLKTLDMAGEPVSAGYISEAMQVSSARVAVLLKKMTERELIVRESSPDDARKAMISLSEKGRERVAEVKANLLSFFAAVIDRVGTEKFEQFIDISYDIKKAVEEELDCRKGGGKC